MRKILVSAAAVAAIATAAPAFAQAGPTSTATATASAEVVAPIQITNQSNMAFGRIASGPVGSVSVDGTGALTSDNPDLLIAGETGSAATFHVTGQLNLAYNVDIDPDVTLEDGAGNSMTATLSGPATGTVNDDANTDITVTGSLAVGANQPAGNYTGTFSVAVQYQ